MSENGTSPWVWIGCGCAALVVLGLAGIGGLTWVGVRTARDIGDPERSRANALELLGADELPDGYRVELALDLPFAVELVALEGEGREFVYMRGIGRGRSLPDFEEGKIDLVELLEDAGVNLGSGEIVAAGSAVLDPLVADWIVYRGEIDLQEVQGPARGNVDLGDHGDADGLATVAVLRCPGDRKLRLGIWRGPDPEPERAAESLDLTGTTGDPEAVRGFLAGFRLCG